MKIIRVNAIITSIRSKVDRSLGLTIATPELSVKERAIFMEYQGLNSEITIKPLDVEPEGVETIDKDIETKTNSQRLRSVLFVLWKQEGENGDFNTFYKQKMEKVINHFKQKLEP